MTTTLGVDRRGGHRRSAPYQRTAATIAVRFGAKLVSVTRDKSGAVVEGSPDAIADHLDVWTFSRDVASSDPNWLLAATQTVHLAAAAPDGGGRTPKSTARHDARRLQPLSPSTHSPGASSPTTTPMSAFDAFCDWARAALAGGPPLRLSRAPSPSLIAVARAALDTSIADAHAARRFFVERFRPWRVRSDAPDSSGFLTGYYEPLIEASLTRTAGAGGALARLPWRSAEFRARRRAPAGLRGAGLAAGQLTPWGGAR